MSVTQYVTRFFLDRGNIESLLLQRVTEPVYRQLMRAGGYVMTVARHSLRVRRRVPSSQINQDEKDRIRKYYYAHRAYMKGRATRSMRDFYPQQYSKPGEPPRLSGPESSLKRLLVYAFDPVSQSVVIGPIGFKNSKVPEILEFGGQTAWRGKKSYYMEPRPYMGPALTKSLDKIGDIVGQLAIPPMTWKF